jgi:hypothetical protein
MTLTPVTAASQILSTTVTVMNAVRERAQSSKDIDLKKLIGELYDNVNSLKEAVRRAAERKMRN